MHDTARIILNRGKEQGLLRFHPWIFSGAIKKIEGKPSEGDVVSVYDSKEKFLGRGHYANGSIAVRILTFSNKPVDDEFWQKRIAEAVQYREKSGILNLPYTNCFRLVFGEGDSMPGLIVDYYNGVAVYQAHSAGMWRAREKISAALQAYFGNDLKAVYDKSSETLPTSRELKVQDGYIFRNAEPGNLVKEYGNTFEIDWKEGQKTGFFLDQRENRKLLASYAEGKKVLNTFSYSGGFSVYAMNAGAVKVVSVDSSKSAIELAKRNMDHNRKNWDGAGFYAEDTFTFFEKSEDVYDIIILDPPAFAKHHRVSHNAIMGYKRLNQEAIKRIAPGGILFTFSCSQVIDRKTFYNTVLSGAINAKRKVRVMHHLSQPADHPVNLFHPEGEYLKGLVLYVD